MVDRAKDMGLVAADWVTGENRNSRSSQISNAIRHSDLFTHVGDHKYAIAKFPGVESVPLKAPQGKWTSNLVTSHERVAQSSGTAC